MIKRQTGFTLIELIIVMGIIGLSLALSSDMLLGLLNQYKQQGKIAETNIEGVIGLDLLRQDIGRAGYGLPWVISGMTYQEATGAGVAYNDSTTNPPRPIVNGNNTGWAAAGSGVANSDCLVIKAANIARNETCQKWTYLVTGPTHTWSAADPSAENLQNGDYAIVLTPGTSANDTRTLVVTGGVWGPQQAGGTFASFLPVASDPQPLFVYGIMDSGSGPLRMPFNRADYYIMDPSTTTSIPKRCAPNTSILVKSTISHSGPSAGSRSDTLPLLDCVADMKVIFRGDADGDGVIDWTTDTLIIGGIPLTAQQIRAQLKEVRVYILAHEGQKDPTYTHNQTIIHVGDSAIDGGNGHDYNIGTNVNYRWKLYTIVTQPKNMRP